MPARPTLAVCLIVCDEVHRLRAAVESVSPYVDQIVVHDTGSTDGTIALARELGLTVSVGTWNDSFAEARNTALRAVKTDWVLSLDADEVARIDSDFFDLVLHEVPDSLDALGVVISQAAGPDASGLESHTEVKLFRPGRCSWTGRVHEKLVLADGSEPASLTLPTSVLHLVHHGYSDAETVAAKSRRNARLCGMQVADLTADPTTTVDEIARATLDLGRSLMGAGERNDAVRAFGSVRRLVSGGPEWLWATDLLARIALRESRTSDVLMLADALQRGGAGREYCDWLRAHALALHGDLASAYSLLCTIDRLVDVGGRDLDTEQVVRARDMVAARL